MNVEEAVFAERRELAATLARMAPAQWGSATLCAGWQVRDVVAHTTMAFRMSMPKFLVEMVRDRGNFPRMADRVARRDARRLGDAGLLALLRDNIEHPWRPPGGGLVGALSHDVIHGLDITVALGLDRRPPADRVGMVLAAMTSRNVDYFGVDLSDVRLEATDLDWAMGDGAPLRGCAQDLLLVVCGRRLPAALLEGTAAARFTG
jgi:uncharacterized protein (TIGR03083 family)